jgi:hypothetical protein
MPAAPPRHPHDVVVDDHSLPAATVIVVIAGDKHGTPATSLKASITVPNPPR